MAGNAVKEAAEFAMRKWRSEERPARAEATWLAPKTTPFDPDTGYSVPNFAYGYVAEMVEVTVDTETGFISVDRVSDNARDLGIPMLQELHRVMVHGVLHLMGYEDETPEKKAIMREKEDHYLANLPPMESHGT